MTEKRFRKVQGFIFDNLGDGDKVLDLTEIEDMMNALHEENEQLKKELESFKPIIFESGGKPITLYEKGDVEWVKINDLQ